MADKNACRFVILTSPRSGSTWLVSLLNQINSISAYGELFLPRKRKPGKTQWDEDFAYPHFVETNYARAKFRAMGVFSYLDELYSQPGVVGFKLMYSQMRKFPEVLAYLLIHRVRVIHLVRQNPLDLVISAAVKRKLQQSHRLAGQQVAEHVQVELNTKTLIRKLEAKQRKINKGKKLLHLTGLTVLDVAYEDMQKGPNEFQAICRFLSAPIQNEMPSSRFVKMRQESQAEVLKNYGEVRETLAGTQFMAFLE